MRVDKSTDEQEALVQREAKKRERRAALAEFRSLHAVDPEKAREAAREWFERNGEQIEAGQAEQSAFHMRKLREADPERVSKAAESVRRCEADTERAQKASREAVKLWRERNPNKVKKLSKAYRERQPK